MFLHTKSIILLIFMFFSLKAFSCAEVIECFEDLQVELEKAAINKSKIEEQLKFSWTGEGDNTNWKLFTVDWVKGANVKVMAALYMTFDLETRQKFYNSLRGIRLKQDGNVLNIKNDYIVLKRGSAEYNVVADQVSDDVYEVKLEHINDEFMSHIDTIVRFEASEIDGRKGVYVSYYVSSWPGGILRGLVKLGSGWSDSSARKMVREKMSSFAPSFISTYKELKQTSAGFIGSRVACLDNLLAGKTFTCY